MAVQDEWGECFDDPAAVKNIGSVVASGGGFLVTLSGGEAFRVPAGQREGAVPHNEAAKDVAARCGRSATGGAGA